MALLSMRFVPDPVLRQQARKIAKVPAKVPANLKRYTDNMIDTMRDERGVGLAANQVGESSQLIVVDMGFGTDKHDPVVIVNPVITASEDEEIDQEGCLSIPDIFADISRFKRVEAKGVDLNGKDVRYEVEDYLARAFQHELDHLNGKLFWDMLSKVKRDILKRKFKKKLKEMKA